MAVKDRIQLRGGTAAQWASVNPVLAIREPGVESDTGKWKIGDGTTAWLSLAYVAGGTVTYGSTSGTAAQGNDSRIVGAAQRAGGNSFTGTQDFTGATVTGLPSGGSPQFGTVLGKSAGSVTGADVVAASEVVTALGAKANTTDVTAGLNAKANATDVSTALATLPGTYAPKTGAGSPDAALTTATSRAAAFALALGG